MEDGWRGGGIAPGKKFLILEAQLTGGVSRIAPPGSTAVVRQRPFPTPPPMTASRRVAFVRLQAAPRRLQVTLA